MRSEWTPRRFSPLVSVCRDGPRIGGCEHLRSGGLGRSADRQARMAHTRASADCGDEAQRLAPGAVALEIGEPPGPFHDGARLGAVESGSAGRDRPVRRGPAVPRYPDPHQFEQPLPGGRGQRAVDWSRSTPPRPAPAWHRPIDLSTSTASTTTGPSPMTCAGWSTCRDGRAVLVHAGFSHRRDAWAAAHVLGPRSSPTSGRADSLARFRVVARPCATGAGWWASCPGGSATSASRCCSA